MNKLIIFFILTCISFAEDEFFEPGVNLGGYGELHYTNSVDPDSDNDPTTKLDFHRWILFVNYNWTSEWSFKSELEIEHNMIDGSGDYDGEVELEQAYVNYHDAKGNWGYGAGVVLISAGIINEIHEPPTFLSVERPAYNKNIIPTTWFGNGAMAYSSFGDFHVKFVLHEDMKGESMISGTSFSGLRGGRSKGYKSTAYSWTKNIAMQYNGISGLNAGGSFTFNDAPINGDKDNNVAWNLFEVHGQYNANNVIGAFEFGQVKFTHNAPDGTDPADILTDQVASGYYMHLGYNVASLIGWEDCKLVPWFGMGMYDLNTDVDGKVKNTLVGLTWWPIDKISWKIDYDMKNDNDSKTNTLSLGVGYMF